LKGWLTAGSNPFERIHDLRRLIKQAVGVLPDFNNFSNKAEILTPYVSAFRYPGLMDDPMPSRDEFEAAFQHAQAIHDFVLNLLPAEAQP
jgi:molecular chaperone GrpE (heat shock protein)